MFGLILAVDENYGIGKNNSLPWNCKVDLRHFKNVTVGNILIVGRKTWMSLPQKTILKNRNVIVVSNTLDHSTLGVVIAQSLHEALNIAYESKFKDQQVFVIGGAKLFEEAILRDDLHMLYITHIKGIYDCDTSVSFLQKELHKFTKKISTFYEDCSIDKYIKQPFA